MSRATQFWVGILISLACAAAVLWVVDVEQVRRSLARSDWRLAIGGAALGQVLFMLLRAWRWRLMLMAPSPAGPRSGRQVRYWPVFHAQNVGYLITNLLPFRLGDLARSYLVGREPGFSGLQALSTVVLERVLDVLMIAAYLGVAVPLVPALPPGIGEAGLVFSLAAVAGFAIMLLAAANRTRSLALARRILARFDPAVADRWLGRAESVLDGLGILTRWRLLVPVVGLTLLLWLCIVAAYWLGLRACWLGATWPAALLTVCVAAFGISAPSSPGSVGVFHGAVVLGLSVFPLSAAAALSFAVVYHATMFAINLALGLIGLWRSGQSLSAIVSAVRRTR